MSLVDITAYFQVNTSDGDQPLTFDQPVGDLPVVDDARWSAALTEHSFAALVAWIILLVALQFVTWPLVRRIFTRLPDRGWAFARPVSLLLSGYLVWLLSSLHIISFRAIWAGSALLLVGAISWLVLRKFNPDKDDREQNGDSTVIMTAEIVFWVVFFIFLLFRAVNPDSYHPLWGGEKPMEFAHLNAILRSAHFPPVDPWYAGGFINYYYYGTYLVAFMIKLTGIPVEVAFNLAQPTFVAFIASAAFSITAALGKRLTGTTGGALICGIFGVFFVQFAGNFIVAARSIDRVTSLGIINQFSHWVFEPTRAIPDSEGNPTNITEFPFFAALYADLHPHTLAMPFTFLVIAIAWQLATQWRQIPMMFIRREIEAQEGFSFVAPLLLAALAIGTLYMTNAWDLPMYAAITGVGLFMVTQGVPRLWPRLGLVFGSLAVIGLLAFLFILPFTIHYVALFGELDFVTDRTPFLSIESHLGGQLLLTTFGVAALTLPQTGLKRSHLTMHFWGASTLLAGSLAVQWAARDRSDLLQTIGEAGTIVAIVGIWLLIAWTSIGPKSDFQIPEPIFRGFVILAGIVTLGMLFVDRATLGFYLGVGLPAAVLWFTLERPTLRFLMALVAGATLLGASLEIVFLVDDLVTTTAYRMNTIFKFYNQIWNLLSIVTAVVAGRAVWHVLLPPSDAGVNQDHSARNRPTAWTWLTAGLVVPIAIASLAYVFVATPVRLDTAFEPREDGLTLNAYSWMEYGQIPLYSVEGENLEPLTYADDLAAINWLNKNVDGTPVIAEAAFGTYSCNGSRFSIATGLPAPVGWVRHEMQQRYPDELVMRESALRTLYTTESVTEKLRIIDEYNIEYIILGETERHYPTIDDSRNCIDTGSPGGITVLENMAGEYLEMEFKQGSTVVYRVIHTKPESSSKYSSYHFFTRVWRTSDIRSLLGPTH